VIFGKTQTGESSQLLELEAEIKKELIGQDKAVEQVCQRLQMAYAGLGRRRGPLAVFIFLGPSGVGKTELARLLTVYLLGSESDMIRIDMSEYMEEHSVAKLIGSPPGYVGHEEEGQLTGKLRTRPHSVVLFDEIEKAHSRVFDVFLQLFDEGRLTDSKGRTVDAKNAIFIMTSNISADKRAGFIYETDEAFKTEIFKEMKTRFRPEFINRIDEQVIFQPLTEEDVKQILKKILDEICKNLAERHKAALKFSEDALKLIVSSGYSYDFGVRELRRMAEKHISIPLSRLILNGDIKKSDNWQVVVQDNQAISIVPVELC